MKNSAIFPGSFNPFHKGHLNVLMKALKIFDKVYLVISQNENKEANNFKENYFLIKKMIGNLKNVEVLINQNKYTAELAKNLNVNFIIRSARNNLDYEYELDLASGNKLLNHNLETILIIPDQEYKTYSSTLERIKNV